MTTTTGAATQCVTDSVIAHVPMTDRLLQEAHRVGYKGRVGEWATLVLTQYVDAVARLRTEREVQRVLEEV